MIAGVEEASPVRRARIAGAFYLGTVLTAPLGLVLRGRLVVRGDATATAANILAHQTLFHLAFAGTLVATACYIVVTALLYDLFKPVNRSVSLTAAFFSLVGCATGAVSGLFHLLPLVVLEPRPELAVFSVEQLRAVALLSLTLRNQTEDIGIVFFGVYCLLIGYLIFRSGFLPRFVGVAMAVAGAGWLTFLWTPLAQALQPWNQASGLGEVVLLLWLLVRGVDGVRWRERAEVTETLVS